MADDKEKKDKEKDELEEYIMALVMLYVAANEEYINMIVKNLELTDAEKAGAVSMTTMLNRVNSLTTTLKNSGKSGTNTAIKNAYDLGYANALYELGKIESIKKGMSDVKYTDEQQAVLDKLMTDTYNDLLVATKYMSEASKKFIRVKTSQVMQIKSALRQGNRQLVRTLMYGFTESALARDAARQGFTGIVDKAGRKWNLQTYAEMVVRTKLTQAHIQGTSKCGQELGYHLYIISSHNAIDACINWEGEIITIGEKIEGYYSYEELAESGEIWHPNCKHHLTPISDDAASKHLSRRGKRATLKPKKKKK